MRIAVISDTHVPDKFETLSKRLLENLQDADLILHCGDIVSPSIIDTFQRIAPFEAVAGNHDILKFQDKLPRKKIVSVNGFRIGMVHGDTFKDKYLTRDKLLQLYKNSVIDSFIYGEPVDIIVFGHCHQPIIDSVKAEFFPPEKQSKKTKKSVLLFNPGMCIRNRHLSTIGFITLKDKSYDVQLRVFTQ